MTEKVDGVEKEVATGGGQDVKTEMLQREERSCNIVIYGLEETTEDKADKWREGKTDKVVELVGKIGVQIEGKVAVKFQTGKRREVGKKPRPLVVRVTDDKMRTNMFRNARTLSG